MSNKTHFFITGTDTDAGKTYFSSGLLAAAKRQQKRTIGLKPVAAGAIDVDGEWRNEDALSLMAQTTVELAYEQINPILLKSAVAPHIAAVEENAMVKANSLLGFVKGALLSPYDLALVEGAGGWRVPINEREMMSDLAQMLNFPVIMVVNMKLGCINHAILTAEAIVKDGLVLAGWVANFEGEMNSYQENVMTLKQCLAAPLVGEIPRHNKMEDSFTIFDEILSNILS